VTIAGTQGTAFQIAELVEHEQRMIAGAVVVAIPEAVLLLAVRRTHARIHIEQDTSRRTATNNATGKISERPAQSNACTPVSTLAAVCLLWPHELGNVSHPINSYFVDNLPHLPHQLKPCRSQGRGKANDIARSRVGMRKKASFWQSTARIAKDVAKVSACFIARAPEMPGRFFGLELMTELRVQQQERQARN
jgi:hypothetical protein